jgi:alpha-galactosidase
VTTPPIGPVPFLIAGPDGTGTGLVVLPQPQALPVVWAGPVTAGLDPAGVAAAVSPERSCPLLPEHGTGWFGRPGLSGYRVDNTGGAVVTGQDWSPLFQPLRTEYDRTRARIEAADQTAGLRLVTDVEAVPGGAIRARHTLTNAGRLPYAVAALEVVFPLPAEAAEILDFSGRHLFERTPQRHRVTDGLWLREGRRGHPGHDAATLVVAGTPGFGFGHGEVYGVHVAWSGNTVHLVERMSSRTATIGGGELLLPGEICLAGGESYTTPWVYLAAGAGLDELASRFHGYLRSVPAHPRTPRPVNLNVWEAVYFDHDLGRLTALADLAAEAGPSPRCSGRSARCCPSTTSPTSSGTATGTSPTPAAGPARARPPRTPRRRRSTTCSTRCAPGTPGSSGSPARPAAAGSTWASWSEWSGSGPPT